MANSALRKGWLKIPGVQDGDRSLEEQMAAVWPAVEECAGKTVLDLGSAEGLIALEFAKAGAAAVIGLESVPGHIEVARQVCEGHAVIFQRYNLNHADPDKSLAFDIVLALGLLHKLRFPEPGLRFAARSARSLLLLRSGRGSVNGIIKSKYHENYCDSHMVLKAEGFALEKVVDGPPPHNETVEYWRRTC